MKDWVSAAKGIAALTAMIAAAILYFAPMTDLKALAGRVSRGEINQELLFQKKVIMMLKDECGPQAPPGRCDHEEATCYEEAQHRLEQLREEKKGLENE